MMPRHTRFDAIVIGSGATGGCAAKFLCEGGLDVVVVEAGELGEAPQQPRSGPECEIQKRCYAYNQHTSRCFINDRLSPYTTPPGKPFTWIRTAAPGGRTLLWAGQSYRMSDLDFQAAGRDGWGEDWPLKYEELAPFYAQAERVLRVTGNADGLPQLPDGECIPGANLDANEFYLSSAFAKNGQPLIPARISVGGRYLAPDEACMHCGRAQQGCLRHTSSPASTLADALATGRMTLLTGALARHIITGKDGRAAGVYVIDKKTGASLEIFGRILFLCASALESTRIMLNSASPTSPGGFANSSGALGHYLMDHVSGVSATAFLGNKGSLKPAQESAAPRLLYAPRSQNLNGHSSLPFLRGYGWQVSVLRASRYFSKLGLSCGGSEPGRAFTRRESSFLADKIVFRAVAFGEMLPRYESRVEIDPEGKVDAWGIPTLRIDCSHGENETKMALHMAESAHKLVEAAGGTLMAIQKEPLEPGASIHEAGTCRMGLNPKTSVLNRYNQCHDSPNVFVTDGSSFTSQGTQNPTLTMMALTMRACSHALDQLRNGELA